VTYDFVGTVLNRLVQGITDPGIGQVGSTVSGSLSYQYPPPSPGVVYGSLEYYGGVVTAMSLTVGGVQFNSGSPANQAYAVVTNDNRLQFTYDPLSCNTAPFNLFDARDNRDFSISLNGPTMPTSMGFPSSIKPGDYPDIQGQFTYANNTSTHPQLGNAIIVFGFRMTSFALH
jgi:hypothetical protein